MDCITPIQAIFAVVTRSIFKRRIESPPEDAISFWYRMRNENVNAPVCNVAMALLSAPASTAEVERMGSSLTGTVTPHRSRMGTDIVEALSILSRQYARKEL